MQQVKTKDIAVIALAIILVLFLWYRFIYSSFDSQASKAKAATEDAKTQLKSLQHQLNVITGKDGKKKASDAELQQAIPATPEVSTFLRQVQQVRDAVGIPEAFQTITPSPPTNAGGATTINMGITVQGSYAQMMDYVNRLNKLSRLVVVDNVGITAGAAAGSASSEGPPTGEVFAGQGAPPQLQLQLTARLFTTALPPVTGTNGVSTPAPTPTPAKTNA